MSRATAASAPGKVLLAGGYLVLDRAYTGLSFGLSARIHVHVSSQRPSSDGVSVFETVVKSPQFKGAEWRYGYRAVAGGGGGVEVNQLRVDSSEKVSKNPFVETALAYALSYVNAIYEQGTLEPLWITILADKDYYSSSSTMTSHDGFTDFGIPLSEAHKTGLGSSAALVTAFTAAVLSFYLPDTTFSLQSETGRRQLHNLAQIAHCAAQGKVGSGFDVASAVYGTCVYRRFSPSIVSSVGDLGSEGFADRLRETVQESGSQKWDVEIIKDQISMPKGLRLVMCDVDCGSETPGMVKDVLEWRQNEPERANELWTDLQAANEGLAAELVLQNQDWDLTRLRYRILYCRTLIRDMTDASNVLIEPPAQTILINACSSVKGVVSGIVPGAGGYDAIAFIVEDRDDVIEGLRGATAEWKNKKTADGAMIGSVNILEVREEFEGLRAEDEKKYTAWI